MVLVEPNSLLVFTAAPLTVFVYIIVPMLVGSVSKNTKLLFRGVTRAESKNDPDNRSPGTLHV